MMYNEYWETDEFEDLVSRGLIGLYETKLKKDKRGPKASRFNEDLFNRFRKIGCYFPSHDRIIVDLVDENGKSSAIQEIDILNDGLPNYAIYTNKHVEGQDYLHSFFMEKVPFLPTPFASSFKGTYYKIVQIFFTNKYVGGCGTFIVIDQHGKLQSCYTKNTWQDPITNKFIKFENRPVMHDKDAVTNLNDFYATWASITIQLYQDRRYLWNVQAHEGIAKATFSVYPEQIQSLFYARNLPQTDTGRKRPILHWVQAHQRRMKSGTEVDIEQYLRGTHEFVMNGTKFKITNPSKEEKDEYRKS